MLHGDAPRRKDHRGASNPLTGTLRAVPDPIGELRTIASTAPEPRAELAPYLAKVRRAAYTVTDGDLSALKQAGVSDDEIFEATVAVAIGEGLRRLDAALEVIP
jgi:alkylhydroperoxidase family enzyme